VERSVEAGALSVPMPIISTAKTPAKPSSKPPAAKKGRP
jgi:hypothetical protein